MSAALRPDSEREAWLEERSSYIGGSDVAAILGIGYHPPIQVWREKIEGCQLTPPSPVMQFGNDYEPFLLERYRAETGLVVRKPEGMRHPELAHIACNPDGISEDGRVMQEIKTTRFVSAPEWGDANTDQVPLKFRVQALYNIEVFSAATGIEIERCDFIVFDRSDCLTWRYSVPRDQEQGQRLIQAADRFWREHVLTQEPPSVDGSPEYARYLSERYQDAAREVKPASSAADEWTAQALKLQAEIKVRQEGLALLKNHIAAEIGDAHKLSTMHGDVIYTIGKTRSIRLPKEN